MFKFWFWFLDLSTSSPRATINVQKNGFLSEYSGSDFIPENNCEESAPSLMQCSENKMESIKKGE